MPTTTPLRVLIVEDRPADAELMVHELEHFGFEPQWKRVETEAEYLAELAIAPDVILADHTLPEFNAARALDLLKESSLDIPFIVVTGSIDEETAVQRIKQGAADYILKDRMARLASAVEHALEEKRLREEKRRSDTFLRESEARKRAILDSALECIITIDHQGKIVEFNPAAERTFGYARAEVIGKEMSESIIPPSLRESHRRGLAHYLATGEGPVLGKRLEITAIRAGGSEFPVELSIIRIPGSEPPMFTGFIRDITERKRREREIQQNLERIRALHEIDLAITSTLDLNTRLKVLLEKIGVFLPIAAATTVRLRNRESGELESLACRGLDEQEWSSRARPVGGWAQRVVETGAPVMVRNIEQDQPTYETDFFRREGLVSYLGVPLVAHDELLGILSLYTRQEHEFSQEEIDFLNTLAGQAAIAIHNAQLYEEMARANKVKGEFLSVMSHELRTPLSVVTGYVGMIKDRMLGEINPQQEQALQKVLGRANDQINMINDIMQTTQLESRATVLERLPVSISDLMESVRSNYEAQPDRPAVNLLWDYPDGPLEITTDKPKVKQILQNVISNALKFTDKGTVTVSARIVDRRPETGDGRQGISELGHRSSVPGLGSNRRRFVEFTVSDTGVGIARDQIPTIFDKFYQVDSSETRLYGGVGLGLYIVKKFTELLGGKIDVQSEVDKGTTFTVTIPVD